MQDTGTAEFQVGARPSDRSVTSFREQVCTHTVRLCSVRYGESLRAIVLTGSLARDEGTFVPCESGWKAMGDAEFLLIFDDSAPMLSAHKAGALEAEIERSLAAGGLFGQIQLSPVPCAFLRGLEPHAFAFELRACGRVVWGEAEILSLIPGFSTTEIPREDAWRTLSNRMIELLEVASRLPDRPHTIPHSVSYRVAKLYLDAASSFLIFTGEYAPTYRERARLLHALAERSSQQDGPFPLGDFTTRVALCTEWKLSGKFTGPESDWEVCRKCIEYAGLLWQWELRLMTRARTRPAEEDLVSSWMRQQPVWLQLRGWASALRRRGWLRTWRQWPHWFWLACQGSPRYCIYRSGVQLLLALPALLEGRSPSIRMDELVQSLPERSPNACALPNWRRAAADVVWNYNFFLSGTRA